MDPPTVTQVRRRKKRSSGGNCSGFLPGEGGPLGSSLTGLRRNNLRVVELVRRSTGYGFTISGQKPCLLRSIIDGSPAALAGLRKGHCLVGVNGKEVTHLAHDEVVRMIGKSTGFLRLHVTESYFSESSDDESVPPRLRSPSSVPLTPTRRILRRDPVTNTVSFPTALRRTKVSPRTALTLGYCYPPTPPVKKPVCLKQPPKPSQSDDEFEADPNSLMEILGNPRIGDRNRKSLLSRFSLDVPKQRYGLNHVRLQPRPENESDEEIQPRPLEVSVIITSPSPQRNSNERRDNRRQNSDETTGQLNSSALYPPMHKIPLPLSCARNGSGTRTRSLDNLCAATDIDDGFDGNGTRKQLEYKGTIGASTPALNEVLRPIRDQFWEFKVPQAPKPTSENNQAKKWAESIEKLLSDTNGVEVFTEFLEHEFSAENIHFYTTCLQYKESYPNLTNSQKISVASTIFQKHLQNGASDPVNVDHQARHKVEKGLHQPTLEIFDLPLSQVFNLLKFDCYPRFLKSETYRDYVSGMRSSIHSQGEITDSDADSVKSGSKFQGEVRRKSLLPWNIKNRSKKKRNKDEQGSCSDLSFIPKSALNGAACEASDQDEDLRRQGGKVCKVNFPDGSSTLLPNTRGVTLATVVQRLLEKREFLFSAFEVISASTGKAIDLNTEVLEVTAREVKVEPRAFIGIELPLGWKVGIRANPVRKMSEVLKPILAQHSLKLDSIVIHDIQTGQPVELKCPVGKVDGRNLSVETKGELKSEEFTTHITEFPPSETHQFFDDDQLSAKTNSSHASSVFKDFLRRSSKKYKREMRNKPLQTGNSSTASAKTDDERKDAIPEPLPKSYPTKSNEVSNKYPSNTKGYDDRSATTKSPPEVPTRSSSKSTNPGGTIGSKYVTSPLSLMHSELNLAENSRNRKPIYVSQAIDNRKS